MISSYYARHGGCSDYGYGCGVFCIHAYSATNTTGWFVGAALSLLHIILFVVVVLSVALIVVFFMFMLTLVLLLPIGVFVLLYHLN